ARPAHDPFWTQAKWNLHEAPVVMSVAAAVSGVGAAQRSAALAAADDRGSPTSQSGDGTADRGLHPIHGRGRQHGRLVGGGQGISRHHLSRAPSGDGAAPGPDSRETSAFLRQTNKASVNQKPPA